MRLFDIENTHVNPGFVLLAAYTSASDEDGNTIEEPDLTEIQMVLNIHGKAMRWCLQYKDKDVFRIP